MDATGDDAPRPTRTDTDFGADNSPTFIWEGVSTAVTYEIIVKNLLETGQPVVLNEITTGTANFFGELEYETTTNLGSGSFRWWIRGLNTDGTPGPWSQPLDFQLTSAGPQQESVGDVEDTIMLTSVPASEQWADRLNSITVHPAAVVAAMNPEVEATVKVVDRTESAAPVDIDAIMEELSQSDWWSVDLSEVDRTNDAPQDAVVNLVDDLADRSVIEVSSGEQPERPVTAAALGLVLAGMVKPVRTKKDD